MKIQSKINEKSNWTDISIIKKFIDTSFANDDNKILESFIGICGYIELYTGNAIIKKTINLFIGREDGRTLTLPYPPIISIDNISYNTHTNNNITIDNDLLINESGILYRPNILIKNDFFITYKAGYETMSQMPNDLLLAAIEHMYSLYTTGSISPKPNTALVYSKFKKIRI